MVGGQGRLILRDVDCVTGEDLQVTFGVDVVIEDGVITEIGAGAGRGEGLSLPGHAIVPGLINCHTHIGDAAFAGRGFGNDPQSLLWPPEGLRHQWMAAASPELVVAGMRAAVEAMLATGTVAFADFREQGAVGVRQLHEATAGLPITALAFGRHAHFPLHSEADLEANSVGLSEEQLAEIASVLDSADGFSPLWANDTTDRGLAQTAAITRRLGKRLATHAGETPHYRELSKARAGRSDVTRAIETLQPDFIVHMTCGTEAEFDELAAAGVPVVMCPRTQAALGIGVPPMLTAIDRGVTVGLGTDNAMMSTPDLLGEMSFFARALRAVTGDVARPTARQLLAAATTDAARILGLQDRLGHLATGREATFLVLDMTTPVLRHVEDPVVAVTMLATRADVRAVVIAGALAHGSLDLESVNER